VVFGYSKSPGNGSFDFLRAAHDKIQILLVWYCTTCRVLTDSSSSLLGTLA
jgi:hypothetical protein